MPVDLPSNVPSLMLITLLKGNPLVGSLTEIVAIDAQSVKNDLIRYVGADKQAIISMFNFWKSANYCVEILKRDHRQCLHKKKLANFTIFVLETSMIAQNVANDKYNTLCK